MNKAKPCRNCGAVPPIIMVEGEFEYLLYHNEDTCPNRIEIYKHKESECVNEWNELQTIYTPYAPQNR